MARAHIIKRNYKSFFTTNVMQCSVIIIKKISHYVEVYYQILLVQLNKNAVNVFQGKI